MVVGPFQLTFFSSPSSFRRAWGTPAFLLPLSSQHAPSRRTSGPGGEEDALRCPRAERCCRPSTNCICWRFLATVNGAPGAGSHGSISSLPSRLGSCGLVLPVCPLRWHATSWVDVVLLEGKGEHAGEEGAELQPVRRVLYPPSSERRGASGGCCPRLQQPGEPPRD